MTSEKTDKEEEITEKEYTENHRIRCYRRCRYYRYRHRVYKRCRRRCYRVRLAARKLVAGADKTPKELTDEEFFKNWDALELVSENEAGTEVNEKEFQENARYRCYRRCIYVRYRGRLYRKCRTKCYRVALGTNIDKLSDTEFFGE